MSDLLYNMLVRIKIILPVLLMCRVGIIQVLLCRVFNISDKIALSHFQRKTLFHISIKCYLGSLVSVEYFFVFMWLNIEYVWVYLNGVKIIKFKREKIARAMHLIWANLSIVIFNGNEWNGKCVSQFYQVQNCTYET